MWVAAFIQNSADKRPSTCGWIKTNFYTKAHIMHDFFHREGLGKKKMVENSLTIAVA